MDDVDWVIQYDAPKMVNSFVHRCGRTARSNREGNALTLLLPNEEAFVNFLRINQNVPLQRYDEINQDVDQSLLLAFLKRVQDIASKERYQYLLTSIFCFHITQKLINIHIERCMRKEKRLLYRT